MCTCGSHTVGTQCRLDTVAQGLLLGCTFHQSHLCLHPHWPGTARPCSDIELSPVRASCSRPKKAGTPLHTPRRTLQARRCCNPPSARCSTPSAQSSIATTAQGMRRSSGSVDARRCSSPTSSSRGPLGCVPRCCGCGPPCLSLARVASGGLLPPSSRHQVAGGPPRVRGCGRSDRGSCGSAWPR
eukprot:COSAG01_NODE_8089_length_2923_cov_3.175513_2_plen_185_part_00